MFGTGNLRLTVTDAVRYLFPRNEADRATSLLDKCYPVNGNPGPRGPLAKPRAAHTHEDFLHASRENAMRRGREVRNRIYEILGKEQLLIVMDNLDDLGTAVNHAMQCARRFGEPMYISPGLLAPPDLAQDYADKGFETVVPFANFRPALLKVNYIPAVKAGKKGRWTLQVIDIRSMHPGAELREAHRLAEINEAAVKEGQRTYTLHPGDTLKLETYHFLISRLIAAARDKDPLLSRLTVSSRVTQWRYTGCYAASCWNHACCLNCPDIRPEDLERELGMQCKVDKRGIKETLFRTIPAQLIFDEYSNRRSYTTLGGHALRVGTVFVKQQ